MRGYSADPSRDFLELYRRLIFTILVSNKDDHLKNHGFLYVGRGQWRLSPMFDVNPAPDRNPHLETAIFEGGAHVRSIELAFEACEFFEIKPTEARAQIRGLAATIAQNWRGALRDAGIIGAQARSFEPAFEHDQAEIARGM
jgi:serine/threonine-protein kinase HipA